jgi:hypothetical protein
VLAAFVLVADKRSFTKVAVELSISQVSKRRRLRVGARHVPGPGERSGPAPPVYPRAARLGSLDVIGILGF